MNNMKKNIVAVTELIVACASGWIEVTEFLLGDFYTHRWRRFVGGFVAGFFAMASVMAIESWTSWAISVWICASTVIGFIRCYRWIKFQYNHLGDCTVPTARWNGFKLEIFDSRRELMKAVESEQS